MQADDDVLSTAAVSVRSMTGLRQLHTSTLTNNTSDTGWAHSTTLGASTSNSSATSTLYIYGGDAKTDTSQTQNTRTNALIALDVSTNWSIASPPLRLVQPDNGNSFDPPQTSLGAMFSSADGQDLYCELRYNSETMCRVDASIKKASLALARCNAHVVTY